MTARVNLVAIDQDKPQQFKGQPLFYVLADYGGKAPYLRLFEARKSRDYYLANSARRAGRVLGIGKVVYR